MKTELGVDNSGMENRDKERDRRGRGTRGSRFSDADSNGGGSTAGKGNRDRSRERRNCRVYISNIPYDYRWQDLKDLFRRIVGSVEYVELFHDEMGKARGCGIVEFKDPDNVEKALEKMNRYEINGRELVVKEDHGEQRDQYGRIVRDGAGNAMIGGGSGGGGGGGGNMRNDMSVGDRDRNFGRRDDDRISGRNNFNMMSNDFNSSSNYNLYGLSASFLESLGINGPLHNKVFVANLDYKVDNKKLKQVFKLAGKVQSVDLSVDKEGNSRGFAVVEFDHPVEAVQAISMLDRQMLYDRRMTVRLDRIPDKSEGLKLPEGLGGVGIGLGPNGEPLRDVARNLPNIINQQQPMLVGGTGGGIGNLAQHITSPTQAMTNVPHGNANNLLGNLVANMGPTGNTGNMGGGGGVFGNANVQPTPVAPVAPVVQTSAVKAQVGGASGNLSNLNLNNLSSSNLAALSNVVGLGAALSNPLLTSSLSNLGLNLSGSGQSGNNGGNDDNLSMTPAGNPLSNNYSTGGNNYSSNYGTPNYMNSGGGGGGVGNSSSSGGNVGVGNNATSTGGNVGFNAYNSGGNNNGNGDNDYNTVSEMYNSGGGGGGAGGGSGGNVRKSDSIIIRNLPLSCTWQTLRDKFRDVGEVKYAEIRGNDLGVVRFLKERDAELAIALMDGSRIDGRTIKVTYF